MTQRVIIFLAFMVALIPILSLGGVIVICSLGGLFYSLFLMRSGQKKKGNYAALISLTAFLSLVAYAVYYDHFR